MELRNKVVMITGSSHGIGKQTAFKFAREECRLVITYHTDKKAGEAVAHHCFELGAEATSIHRLDLTEEQSIRSVSSAVIDKFGEIDVLINNAGFAIRKEFGDQSLDEIGSQLQVNLLGLIKLTRLLCPHTKKVINIGSGASRTGYGELSVYCASKFGLRGFTESLIQEGYDVQLINPGRTATRMTDFEGRPAEDVAELIYRAAMNEFKDWETNIWDVMKS